LIIGYSIWPICSQNCSILYPIPFTKWFFIFLSFFSFFLFFLNSNWIIKSIDNIKTEGIFRVPGNLREMKELKLRFERGFFPFPFFFLFFLKKIIIPNVNFFFLFCLIYRRRCWNSFKFWSFNNSWSIKALF